MAVSDSFFRKVLSLKAWEWAILVRALVLLPLVDVSLRVRGLRRTRRWVGSASGPAENVSESEPGRPRAVAQDREAATKRPSSVNAEAERTEPSVLSEIQYSPHKARGVERPDQDPDDGDGASRSPNGVVSPRSNGESLKRALRITQLVKSAAARSPYRLARCLPQSLVAQRLLRRRNVDARLRIGVKKTAEAFEAHAWIEVDGLPLAESAALLDDFVPIGDDASIDRLRWV